MPVLYQNLYFRPSNFRAGPGFRSTPRQLLVELGEKRIVRQDRLGRPVEPYTCRSGTLVEKRQPFFRLKQKRAAAAALREAA